MCIKMHWSNSPTLELLHSEQNENFKNSKQNKTEHAFPKVFKIQGTSRILSLSFKNMMLVNSLWHSEQIRKTDYQRVHQKNQDPHRIKFTQLSSV